jgi:hypothetical protein
MYYIAFLLRAIAGSIALAAWAVVGFLVWVPFLLRTTGMYVVATTQASFTGESLDAATYLLDRATLFWYLGFELIISNVLSPNAIPFAAGGFDLNWHLFLREAVSLVITWGLTVVLWQGFAHGWWSVVYNKLSESLT